MKRILLFTTVVLSSFTVFAQHEFDKWIFGNGAGLDFSSGSPVVIGSAISGWDNSASIADSAGNLLFYSNGELVWDKNGNVMPHGTGILGDTTGGQSATIVKQPESDSRYFMFTSDSWYTPGNGIRYTVIDMSLNGGLGDVDTTEKNVVLLSPNTTEKIVPILHGDGINVWIVFHEDDNNTFRAYLLTPGGLETTPIVSSVGTNYSTNEDGLGQLTVNKQGTLLASALYGAGKIELYNFNNYLGLVSNPVTISGYSKALGLEFSPDGSKLYETGLLSSALTQFDLSTYNATAIAASAVSVGSFPSVGGYYAGYLMLGPDDKIYSTPIFSSYVGKIDQPNTLGSGCNYNGTAINLSPYSLDAGLVGKIGVPHKSCVIEVINEIKVVTEGGNKMKLYPNPSQGFLNVQYDSNHAFDISIWDIEGRLIKEIKQAEGKVAFDLKPLAKGTYVVKLYDRVSETEISQKVVLQ